MANPRCLREPSAASPGEHCKSANTLRTWGERTVFFVDSGRQASPSSPALADVGATLRRRLAEIARLAGDSIANAFMPKPVKPSTLARVAGLLRARSKDAAISAKSPTLSQRTREGQGTRF